MVFQKTEVLLNLQLVNKTTLQNLTIPWNTIYRGSNVIIGSESYSFDEALEIIVAASTFSISGPEEDRLIVGFEQDGSNFRLFASARDGVLSGHGVVCASTNSSEQKNAFHISDTSGSEIFTEEFDLTQNDQSDFAELVIDPLITHCLLKLLLIQLLVLRPPH